MSVIVAIMSNRDAVVASDGREFASAIICNKRVIEKAPIAREDFDKTFVVRKGKVVGAFSGLTRFGNMTIAEHVREIVDAETAQVDSVRQIVESLKVRLAERMAAIESSEVLFEHRKVDVLLAGGAKLTRNHFQLASLNFRPVDGQIQCKIKLHRQNKAGLFSAARGAPLASQAAFKYIQGHTSAYENRDSIESLAKKAVEEGIRCCGPHPQGDDLSCGGSIFSKKTWY